MRTKLIGENKDNYKLRTRSKQVGKPVIWVLSSTSTYSMVSVVMGCDYTDVFDRIKHSALFTRGCLVSDSLALRFRSALKFLCACLWAGFFSSVLFRQLTGSDCATLPSDEVFMEVFSLFRFSSSWILPTEALSTLISPLWEGEGRFSWGRSMTEIGSSSRETEDANVELEPWRMRPK